ncbi:choice-of-anchor M domain-containing protein [Actinoplanes sp. TRM 88003]|uniref:Choice-of-anchor M domain-containing protein n=1 Tax=Paractinoplanes aksuensis TaxID=2939490 RepID=A0ABT1E3S3_9ACTN|nr:choice-of-anchor M domain-containing protein [Actinoplanes aksuensis]MCO8277790.1 choice-of-anchor M domain-containing protein [Actinoplanes aksuensis]
MRAALAVVTAVAVTLITGTPALAAPVTLTSGHVDVLDVDYAAPGTLTLNVNDGTGTTPVERNPADVIFQVPAAAKVTVPSGSAWSFLGTAGSTAWVLPQTNVSGLLWAGWNTEEIPANVLQNNSLTFKLSSVSGPGRVSVYTVSAGTPAKLFDSSDGLPDTRTVARNAHTHANWGFTQSGTYTVTFEVTARLASTGATVSTGAKAFTFTVLP